MIYQLIMEGGSGPHLQDVTLNHTSESLTLICNQKDLIALILKDLLSDENLYFKFADKYSRIIEENTKKSLVKLSKKALATLTAYGLTDFLNTKLFS